MYFGMTIGTQKNTFVYLKLHCIKGPIGYCAQIQSETFFGRFEMMKMKGRQVVRITTARAFAAFALDDLKFAQYPSFLLRLI